MFREFIVVASCFLLLPIEGIYFKRMMHPLRQEEQHRIEVGTDVTQGQYPFVAAIYLNGEFKMHGAIVSRFHVVTIAIFIQDVLVNASVSDLTLVAGSNVDLTSIGIEHWNVTEVIYHENFQYIQNSLLLNNIVLLKFDCTATFGDYSMIANLPPQNYIWPYGTIGTFLAWNSAKTSLKANTRSIISDATCESAGISTLLWLWEPEEQLCIAPDAATSMCEVDAAAVLVANDQLAGIGFYPSCANIYGILFPETFLDIAHFTNWILVNAL